MANVTLVVGNDGSDTLQGTAGKDLIYGFDPNGPQSAVGSIAATRVASGLTEPLFAGAPAGDLGRLFIVEKGGLIKILNLASGQVLATPFLDVTGQVATTGEEGLLGLAFDPDFATNGTFYVNLSNTGGDTEIRRYQVMAGDPNRADTATVTPIISIDQPTATNHKAGWLDFGPDGYLYAALGDGGSTPANAQNVDSLLGKMLRLDVHADAFPADPARNYAIPADNPFVGVAGADEIFALGLRNPWRPGFDRGLDDLYIADVGQNTWEEVNLGLLGANYGWNVYEGPTFSGGTPSGGTLTAPIYYYSHSVGHSITGGYVYRGESEGLQGQYFFGDFIDSKIFTMRFNGSAWVATERTGQIVADAGTVGSPSSFGEDARGNLYVVDYGGEVFRLTPVVTSADQGDDLRGLDGDDMLFGGSGNDLLEGGAGADTLIGGPGSDAASYASSNAGVSVSMMTGRGSGGHAEGDFLTGIENLIGSPFADTLIGGPDGNNLNGSSGPNTLHGMGGNDYLTAAGNLNVAFGDDDNDQLYFAGGQNQLFGGFGNDWLGVSGSNNALAGGGGSEVFIGATGNGNTLAGQDGDDLLYASGNGNALYGESGSDWLGASGSGNNLSGGAGAEWMGVTGNNNNLDGGEGNDSLFAGGSGNSLFDNAGNNWMGVSGNSNTLLSGTAGNTFNWMGATGDSNSLLGNYGNDSLFAVGSSNTLLAFEGNNWVGVSGHNNILAAAGGSDYLAATGNGNILGGGAGNDTLVGAAGHVGDRFVFYPGYAQDEIFGFAAHSAGGTDVVDLKGFGLTFASLMNTYSAQVGADTVLTLGGDVLTLRGVPQSGLQASDFVFA